MTDLKAKQWALGILFVGMSVIVLAALLWQALNPDLLVP